MNVGSATQMIAPARPPSTIPAIILVLAAVAMLYAWAIVALTPTRPGSIGLNLNALGTDWLVFYGGARWYFDGNLAALLDGERFTAWLNSAFVHWLSQPLAYRPWVYPPSYLLVVLPFGLLPLVPAYVGFQAVTATLLAAALWFGASQQRTRGLTVTAALLGPAAALNVGMGQNAFLTAAILVGGFRLVPVRPLLGGAILGLLTVKPQFWVLVPLALVALRAWKALASSLAAGVTLVLVSAAVFGVDAWLRWVDLARGSYGDAHGQWVELGRLWGDSIYACLVAGGAPEGVANAFQVAGTLTAMALVYIVFRSKLTNDRRLAALLALALFAAPHSSLADTVLLGTAAALWAGEAALTNVTLAAWTLGLALWGAALVNPPLVSPAGRFTPLLILGFIALLIGGSRPGVAGAGEGEASPGSAVVQG